MLIGENRCDKSTVKRTCTFFPVGHDKHTVWLGLNTIQLLITIRNSPYLQNKSKVRRFRLKVSSARSFDVTSGTTFPL